jgi:hypothetical protein
VASSQDSVPLQYNPSLGQLTGVPATQPLAGLQTSAPLQYSPSEHAALLGMWSQLSVASLHESVVQAIPSLQFTGVPAWHCPVPVLQVSMPVQNNPSSHSAFVVHPSTAQLLVSSLHTSGGVQGSPLLTHESVASSQDSVPVQNDPSSGQLTAVPAWHPLAGLQISFPLQYRPSLQAALSGV